MKNKFSQKMKIIQKIFIIVVIALFIIPSNTNALVLPNIFKEAKEILKSNYVNPVSDYVLNAEDMNEMMRRLNDPYSDYFTNEEYSEFVNRINNRFYGIGIQIDIVPQGARVFKVIDNSPALEAGIMPEDIITQVDNINLVGMTSSEEVIGYIKGVVDSYAQIVVNRGGEVINFTVQRREIRMPTVKSQILPGKVAYIAISSFGEETAELFSAEINKMEELKVDSYIIDLRNNGGGYMYTALDIAGHFIGNLPAIIMEDRTLVKYKENAIAHEKVIEKPVIFLINKYSASASEILAAAVKDYDKATFIGATTYGKGVAQQMFPLSDDSYLKITVERFYSPYGVIIHNRGVSPDFQAKDEDIDSLKIANLLLSGRSLPKDKRGYMRIDMDGKVFYVDLKMAREEEYWKEYNYILSQNLSYNAYRGTNLGWESISKADIGNIILQRFSNYKVLDDLKKDIETDKHFKINFKGTIDYDSIKAQGIELINETSGKRTPVKISIDNNTVLVTPLEQLEKGQAYHLVINDSIKDANGKSIKQGAVIRYVVP
jgi:carboxyl-terminal processing protease